MSKFSYILDYDFGHSLKFLMKLNDVTVGTAFFVKRGITYLDILVSEVDCYRPVLDDEKIFFSKLLNDFEDKPVFYLDNFSILKEYQKNGYGSLFLDFLYTYFESDLIVLNPSPLNVSMSKDTLISFYNKHSFKTLCSDKDGTIIWKLPVCTSSVPSSLSYS